MIRYNQAFITNVKGALSARFQLDQGEPKAGEDEGTTFYFIDLSLHAPDSKDIQQVTYFLDAATYWEPERKSKNRKRAFTETITSYGDFLVRVEVEMATGVFAQKALLSDLLEVGHKDDMTPEIEKAITYLREN